MAAVTSKMSSVDEVTIPCAMLPLVPPIDSCSDCATFPGVTAADSVASTGGVEAVCFAS